MIRREGQVSRSEEGNIQILVRIREFLGFWSMDEGNKPKLEAFL